MTPAILLLERYGAAHAIYRYEPTAAHTDFGLDASEQLGVAPDRVFKTLVVELDTHELIVAAVPVSARLHMKSLASAAGARKAFMADGKAVERTTGYVLGGVSPLGQKKALRTFIDTSARDFATVYVSAGRRGLEIELGADTLGELTDATYAAITRYPA